MCGYESCVQGNSDKGYSQTIQAAYETFYDPDKGVIVGSGVSSVIETYGGGRTTKVSAKNIRYLAAAMSIGSNIKGVRYEALKCIGAGQLPYSSSLHCNNYDGSTYGGSSAAWEAQYKETLQKYVNYRTLKAGSTKKEPKSKRETIGSTDYIVLGPYKMLYGGIGIEDIKINGTSAKAKCKYRLGSSNTVTNKFNEKKSDGSFVLNNKAFYLYIKEADLRNYIGSSNKVTIQFIQGDFHYKKGRAFITNDDSYSRQNAMWYVSHDDIAKGAKIKFTATLEDSISITIKKKWDDNNSASRPTSVKVKLTADGKAMNAKGDTTITKTIKSSSDTITITGLKRYDSNGNLMKYKIEEVVPSKYEVSYSPGDTITVDKKKSSYTFTMTNKKIPDPEKIEITVNKIWDDYESKTRPKSIKIVLTAGGLPMNDKGETSITKIIKSNNVLTIDDLRKFDEDGNLMTYTIEEMVPSGYEVSYSPSSVISITKTSSEYSVSITNKKDKEPDKVIDNPDLGTLQVTKIGGDMSFRVWEDSPAQWIKSKEEGSGSVRDNPPEDTLNGTKMSRVSSSEVDAMNKIDAGTKLGSYTYVSYNNIVQHEVRRKVETTTVKKDDKGNTIYDKDGNPETETTIDYVFDYYYYTYDYTKTYKNCVHVITHDWLGSYTTDGGECTISGLYPGSYEIYETECDEYYDLELQDGYSASGYHNVPNIRFATSVSLSENDGPDKDTVKLGKSTSTTVKNTKTRGDIEINKVYPDGTNMDDIPIAIYGEVNIKGYSFSGWLNGETQYEDVPWSSISGIFTGSSDTEYVVSDGGIQITGLPVGTYSIYELKTKSIEYALEGQGTGSFDGEKTLLGTVTVVEDNTSTVRVTYTQKKRDKGDLEINKTGVYTNNLISNPNVVEKLKKVQFVLKSSAEDKGGWKEGDYVYIRKNEKGEDIIDFTEEQDDATVFTTDDNGSVTIKGLYTDLGPYEIIEVENDQQDKYYTDTIQMEGDTEVDISTGGTTANVINRRSSGDLKVIKVDETYNDLKLSGAKFKLKLISGEYIDSTDMWVGNDDSFVRSGSTYDYYNSKHEDYLVDDESDATEFETDENGEFSIKKIVNGTYELYETEMPRGYDITKQDGYDPSTGMVDKGTINIINSDNVIEYQVTNKKVVDNLSGTVWEDMIPSNKAGSQYNHLYRESAENYPDENDTPKEGVQVNLVDKDTGKVRATTVTNKGGYWEFTKYSDGSDIIYWDLVHSYVEYIYDNEAPNENGEYGYVVVNPFTGGIEKLEKNSKAQAIEIKNEELYDANLTGTKEPYPGRAVTYTEEKTPGFSEVLKQNDEVESRNAGTDLEHKLITSYYDNDRFVIENINLGLIQKPETPYSIEESIAYVRIVKGGYTYTYKYGDDAVTVDNRVQSSIKFQNSSRTFTKAIYPSDIKYNLANGLMGSDKDNEINKYKIYVVYKIEVKNNTTENYIDKYTEQGLYLDEKDNGLTNSYDTSRYTLETEQDKNERTEGDANTQVITSDFARWSDNGDGTASFAIAGSNKKYDRQSGQSGIKPLEIESTYIEFRVKDEVLTSLVEKGQDTDQNETAPTVATTNAYHVYTRKDKNWKNKDTYTHETKRKKQSSGALFIKWQLMDTRAISGKVFEDSKVDDLNGTSHKEERVGNGQYDTGEKNLKDVVVSLINAKDNGREDEKEGTVAYLYDENNQIQDETGKWRRAKTIAVTNVDANGNYTFKGVVPGEYYLKFTYGDGTVKFIDAKENDITSLVTNGGKVETKTQDDTKINSIYYKSTVVTGSAKEAMQSESKGEESNKWWFLGDIEKNKSVATDWMGTYYEKDETGKSIPVKDKNGNTYYDMVEARTTSDWESNYTTGQDKVVIDAKSPVMKIEFEYRGELEFQTQNNEIGNLKTDCTEMNFGIMERPHVDIQLSKEIKNVKLTLQNGTTVINGNPLNKNVAEELLGIDKTLARIEINTESLYGAELLMTYKLTATNESEVDYATSDYYKYGDIGDATPATTTVTKIIDYLSYSKTTYSKEEESNVHSTLKEGEKVEFDNSKCDQTIYLSPETIENNNKFSKEYIITKVNTELTPKKADRTGKKSSVDYEFNVSRLMGSVTSEDVGLESYSEIIGLKNLGFLKQYYSNSGNYKVGDTKTAEEGGTSEDDNASSALTITPPTGKNKNMINYVFIVGGLIVMVSGIVLIKKFVL